MPITREEFYKTDEPFRTATRTIRDFLYANSSSAYTEPEILEQVAPTVRDRSVSEYLMPSNGSEGGVIRDIESPALRGLVLAGIVEAKLFDSTLYFALRKDLRRN